MNACLGEDLLEDLVAVTSIADRCGDERMKLVDPQLSSRSECPRNRGDNTIDALLRETDPSTPTSSASRVGCFTA